MIVRRIPILVWSVGIATIVLCAAGMTPNPAAAQCGNYVTILGKNPANQDMPNEHMPKAPCTGPGCSRLPSIPFTPLPAPINFSVDSKACVDFLGRSPLSTGERAMPDAVDDRPIQMPNPIFHPPRIG